MKKCGAVALLVGARTIPLSRGKRKGRLIGYNDEQTFHTDQSADSTEKTYILMDSLLISL